MGIETGISSPDVPDEWPDSEKPPNFAPPEYRACDGGDGSGVPDDVVRVPELHEPSAADLCRTPLGWGESARQADDFDRDDTGIPNGCGWAADHTGHRRARGNSA